jgi:Cd2+/Zn2+-exporting ATPase
LVVSIPLAYFGSIGYASKKGILIKGSKFIDYLDNVKSVFFDKTGTLTKGTFKLTKIVPATGFNEEQLLNLAIIAETHSNHPIAISIKEKKETTENKNDITDYKELAGKGVSVKYNDKHILAGNVYLLRENKVAFKEANEIGTVVYIAINNFYAGYLVVSDQIKPEANKTMKMLKEKGVKEIIILTGDKNTITEKYATELKIDRYFAELLPEDKISIFNKELQKKTKKESYIFVGDGINDAPAIALADVGIAMGNIGTDAAIETADVVIMNDNISLLIDLLQIAKKNKKIIIQNIIISLFVKIFFIMLGIFGDATIWEAVFADVGVTILVIFNAKRVLLS